MTHYFTPCNLGGFIATPECTRYAGARGEGTARTRTTGSTREELA